MAKFPPRATKLKQMTNRNKYRAPVLAMDQLKNNNNNTSYEPTKPKENNNKNCHRTETEVMTTQLNNMDVGRRKNKFLTTDEEELR